MADTQIILDLGEYGTILVEPVPAAAGATKGGLEPAGSVMERVEGALRVVVVRAEDVLQRKLTGLANLFAAATTAISAEGPYRLEEFSVEFELGLSAESGLDAGAVVKVVPNGAFKCTYTWKHQARPDSNQQPMPAGDTLSSSDE